MSEPRFNQAVNQAVRFLPADIATQMNRLIRISDEDISAYISEIEKTNTRTRLQYGPRARIMPPPDFIRARAGLISIRKNKLDWIFFRRWRLADGWLGPDSAKRALEVFNDPLARRMSQAVLAKLYPEDTEFSEY